MAYELEAISADEFPVSLKDFVLKILQKSKVPLKLETILFKLQDNGIKTILSDILSSIKILKKEGYDIKEIIQGLDQYFVLIRYADINAENYYRIHGEIETPLLITSDWHVGSKGYSELAFKELLKDITKYKVKHLMHAGDLIQGRSVHKSELQDLLIPELDKQISLAVRTLNLIPKNVTIHLILGTHEERIKGHVKVGLDPIKLIAMPLSNIRYYGHVAMLKLNKKYRYLMIHGSGAVTKAVTYKPEDVWRELEEKPNIFHTGHSHQLGIVDKGRNHYIIVSGTLQRTNAWLIQKGWTAKVGYIILKDITDSGIEFVERKPIVY